MLRMIYQKEIRVLLQSYKFALVLAMVFFIIPIATWVESRRFEAKVTELRFTSSGYETALTDKVDINPTQFRAMGFVKPHPMSVFTSGALDVIPTSFSVTRLSGIEFANSALASSPFSAVSGKLDFTYCVFSLLSLIAVLFASESISRETELGTLSLLLTYSVRRIDILLAKFSAIGTIMAIPTLLAFAASCTMLSFLIGFPLADGDTVPRLVSLALLYIVYLLLWTAVGLVISIFCRTQSNALIVALAVWSIAILVTPRIMWLGANLIRPVPSLATVEMDKAQRTVQFKKAKESELKKIWNDEEYGKKRETALQRVNKQEAQVLREANDSFLRKMASQGRLVSLMSRLVFPAGFLNSAATICGTGQPQVEGLYRGMGIFRNEIDTNIFSKARIDEVEGMGIRMSWSMIPASEVPHFNFGASGESSILQVVVVDVMWMLVQLVLLILIGVLLFNNLMMEGDSARS